MSVLHDVSVTYLTSAELATILRCHRSSITRMAGAGEIPGAIRMGAEWRFRREAIVTWLERAETKLASS